VTEEEERNVSRYCIYATADSGLCEFHSVLPLFSYNASAQLFPSLASTKLSSFNICNVATIFLK